jgi:hypothetical protein
MVVIWFAKIFSAQSCHVQTHIKFYIFLLGYLLFAVEIKYIYYFFWMEDIPLC